MPGADEMLEDVRSAAKAKSGGIELSEWELEFIESVGRHLNRGHKLTEAQVKKLEEIWDRI